MAQNNHPIIIIGGGAAGVAAALELDKLVGEDLSQPIYLFDESSQHIYMPYIYDVLEHGKNRAHIIPFENIFAGTRVRFFHEKVVSIDAQVAKITTEKRQLKYADLIIANGCEVRGTHRKDSWLVHTLDDVSKVKAGILPDRDTKHYIAVVGGGARGVETTLALQGWISRHVSRRNLPKIYQTLIHAGDRLVPELPKKVSRDVLALIKSYGVAIQLNKQWVWEDHARVQAKKDGAPTHSAVWATGLVPRLLARGTQFRHGRTGRLLTDPALRLSGFNHIWGAGSCIESSESATVSAAWRQGVFVARQIVRDRAKVGIKTYRPIGGQFFIKIGPRHIIRLSARGLEAGFFVNLQAWWSDVSHVVKLVPFHEVVTRLW